MTQAFPKTLSLRCGPVAAIDLALFAAASGDHNPLHLDAQIAQSAGFAKPVVHGMLSMAYCSRLFTQHFGAGCVRRLHTRFTGVALLGDTIVLEATLQEVDSNGAQYQLKGYQLKASNEAGTELVTGSALVLPSALPALR